MKISELKIKKTVHRPTQNFDESGNRIYNAFEYDLPYKTEFAGSEKLRIGAKIIDTMPLFLVFLFIFRQPAIMAVLFSIPSVIILGTVLETLFGTTLGKKMVKLKVIDDYGNYPKIIRSLGRNSLCLAVFYPVFDDYIPMAPNEMLGIEHKETNFTMHMNNKLCKTYIVKENKIEEIRCLLSQKQHF